MAGCSRTGAANPSVAGRITIAVIDSGVHPKHPHIGPMGKGFSLVSSQGGEADTVDRLGHGTAVMAAIQEKAPAARLFPVRVFGETLKTDGDTLAKALERASRQGCDLANLSLGTRNAERETLLGQTVERALQRGTLVVAAFEDAGVRWLPGSLPGVLGVGADPSLPRHELRVEQDSGRRVLFASPYPRPIPGVPPERNLNGISFAVANATGLLALILENDLSLRTPEEVLDAASNPIPHTKPDTPRHQGRVVP